MSLWQITEELSALLNLCDTHGARSEELDAAIAEHSEALVAAFDAKADGYASLIRLCDARATARSEEARRLLALADSDMILATRLRATLLAAMQRLGRDKVETETARIAIRRNGGACPLMVDEDRVPAEYRVPRVIETIDRAAIREALDRGETVEGCALGERGVRLDLR